MTGIDLTDLVVEVVPPGPLLTVLTPPTPVVAKVSLATGGSHGWSYHQAAPASTWLLVHNLGHPREPTILLDSDPTRPVITDVEHLDSNTTLVTFPAPVSGWAYI